LILITARNLLIFRSKVTLNFHAMSVTMKINYQQNSDCHW